MAATAVTIVAREPVKNLFRIIEYYVLYTWNYKRNIKSLEVEIEKIKDRRKTIEGDVPTATNNAEYIRPDVQGWIRTSQGFEDEGGDLLERTKDGESSYLCCNVPNVCFRYSVSKKASERTMDMIRHLGESHFDGVGQPKQPVQLPFLSHGEFYEFESRMLVEKEVLHALEDDSVFEIGICGMAGSGKTTLAKIIAEEVKSSDKRLFDEVAIAVVSKDANINKIQDDLASRLGLSDIEKKTNVQVRAKFLYNRLMGGNEGKRTLIILDDIWEELDLNEVGIPDPSTCKGLKILLTSRLDSVCRVMKVQKIFEVKILSEEEAWALFKLTAQISDQDISPEAREVAMECGGLPLGIGVIGKLLIGKQQYAFKDMLRRLRDTSEGFHDKVYKSIKLSYDYLDSDEKRSILLICSLFPEDHEIEVDYLVKYTMGLSGTFLSMEELEDKVKVIVDELKDCHLLLDGEEEGCVKLHDVVRDVCLSVANKDNQNYMVRHGGLNEWPQNCEYCTRISLTINNLEKTPPSLNYPNLQLLRLDFENERADEVDISTLSIRGMKELLVLEVHKIVSFPFFTLRYLSNLRTLSFEDCSIEGDISGIGHLITLRVLSFFRSHVTMIPEISQLTNLKSLDMRFYYMRGSDALLPGTLSRLKNLEELYLGVYREGVEMEIHRAKLKEVSSLTKLHTVQYSTNSGQCLKTLLESLNVQKLISFDFSNENDMYYNKILSNSLKLVNFDMRYLPNAWGLLGLLKKLSIENAREFENWFRSELSVGSLGKLQEVSLSDVDVKENLWGSLQFPSLCNLKILDISLCHDVESIFLKSTVKLLRQLLKLSVEYCNKLERLVTISHQDGIESSEEVIVFPELQELTLVSLSNFSSIGPDDNACEVLFPKLENIDIRDIPFDKLQFSLPELRLMEVNYCDKLSVIADYKLIEGLQYLEQLIVNSCSSLELIFDFEEINTTTRSAEGAIILLGQLKKLSLHNLPMLKHLMRMLLPRESQEEIVPSVEETPHQISSKPHVVQRLSSCLNGSLFPRPRPKPAISLTNPPKQISAFQHLISLEVEGCDGLQYLLTPTIANVLVSLEKLHLKGNRLMEAIVGWEEDETSHVEAILERKLLLPKLKMLNIDSLSKLRMFSCYPNHHLDLPSLTDLRFSDCPNMSRVCYGEMTATELKSVFYNVDSEHPFKGVPTDIFLKSWLKDCESRIVCLNCRYEEKSSCNHLHEAPLPPRAGPSSSGNDAV